MMMSEQWEALSVQTYGLSPDLFVPVAAADLDAIETYVGRIDARTPGRKRAVNAVVVTAPQPKRNPTVPLWHGAEVDGYYRSLHPSKQLWVHVDYQGYRRAWRRLGFPDLAPEVMLDHIRNRAVVRLSGYRHPFIRLCPVSREMNTSSGLNGGQEGLHKVAVKTMKDQPANVQRRMKRRLEAPIVLADPVDLTKMLDIPPGLSELQGVAAMLMEFYATKN